MEDWPQNNSGLIQMRDAEHAAFPIASQANTLHLKQQLPNKRLLLFLLRSHAPGLLTDNAETPLQHFKPGPRLYGVG